MNDLESERLTWPRLELLLRHLPPTSPYRAAVDPHAAGWTLDSYLLAAIANRGLKEPYVLVPAQQVEREAKDARLRARAHRHRDRLRRHRG